MEIPIDLAGCVQRRPVISVLRPAIDAGEGKIYVERTVAVRDVITLAPLRTLSERVICRLSHIVEWFLKFS